MKKDRTALLEEALLEYIERFGASEKARRVFAATGDEKRDGETFASSAAGPEVS